MSLDLNKFDWGPQDSTVIHNEVFVNNVYERYRSVSPGDIVFDVGANVGAFTYSILPKKPKQVFCFEPSQGLFKYLKKNTDQLNVHHFNKAIGAANNDSKTFDKHECVYFAEGNTYQTTTLSIIRKEYGVDKIDFLKTDCEGGEYDLFTEENFHFLTKKVKYITGEWHLQYKVWEDYTGLNQFIKFRDMFLREKHLNYRILLSYDLNHDITKNIFNLDTLYRFVNYWGYLAQLTVYIENTEI